MKIQQSTISISKGKSIFFRNCVPEDAHLFPTFGKKIASETDNTLLFEGMQFPIDKIKEAWKIALVSKSEFYIGAFHSDQEMIGQIYFKLISPDHPWIKHIGEFFIMVLQEHWGKGVSCELMRLMEHHAKNMQIKRIEAKVRTSNDRAIAFYKKHGYLVEGCRKNSAFINGNSSDEYFIAKLF